MDFNHFLKIEIRTYFYAMNKLTSKFIKIRNQFSLLIYILNIIRNLNLKDHKCNLYEITLKTCPIQYSHLFGVARELKEYTAYS